jgi:hypothetical protein
MRMSKSIIAPLLIVLGCQIIETPGALAEPSTGQLRVWVDGGAVWSGSGQYPVFFSPIDFSPVTPNFGALPSSSFDLRPKFGWDAAAGFDYALGGSAWHLNGQVRYGEGRSAGSFASSGSTSFAYLLAYTFDVASSNGSQTVIATGTERHWLVDLAIGHDVLIDGRNTLQLNAGVRFAELQAAASSFTAVNSTTTKLVGPFLPFPPFTLTTSSATDLTSLAQSSRFIGVGPRLGLEGSRLFHDSWSFDYSGDIAALFGNQNFSQSSTGNSLFDPSALQFNTGLGAPSSNSIQRPTTVFNADLQLGVSYWISRNVRFSASYRIDAYFNVLPGLSTTNDITKLQSTDRLMHGPRIGVTAQF